MNALALALMLALPSGSPGEDIAEQIVAAGHKKVGVIPNVIARQGEKEATISSLGPRSATLAKDLQNQLVALSTTGKYRGLFSVVADRVMRNGLNEVAKNRPLAIDDLGNPKALQALSAYTGAHGFITLNLDETGNAQAGVKGGGTDADGDDDDDKIKKRKSSQAIEISSFDAEGNEFQTGTYRDVNTLSKAAYMGDSFEVRRWSENELLNIGLESDHPQFAEDSNWQFGLGEKWEREHFQRLKSPYDHPLDVDGFPFEIEIVVDDKVRKPQKLRGKYLVELNPDEEYSIYVKNAGSQPVMVALYVDGVNTIDKERREPQDLEGARHWSLAQDYTMNVAGWYMIDSKLQMQKANKFKVVERSDSVAAQAGFEDNIGMITAIFYANDAKTGEYVNYPKDSLLDNLRSVFGESQFGTGSGDEFDEKLEFATVQRGLMLSAVTIYYRSREEIEVIKQGGDNNELVFDNSGELADIDSEELDSEEEEKDE